MKHELGWYFPDGEQHLPDWMRKAQQKRDGVLQYQLSKYQKALAYTRTSRAVAVDVGANIGLWSKNMAQDFQSVIGFEPVPAYQDCWHMNMREFRNAKLYHSALGDEIGAVSLTCGTPGSHGDTFVAPKEEANAAHDVPLRTLDSFGLRHVDFIKIDTEGYEVFVLRGAEKTIRECKPCIIVEQKPGHAQRFGLGERDAVALLKSWGATVRAEMSGDFIMTW